MTTARSRLPNRRASISFNFECCPHSYIATVSYFPGTCGPCPKCGGTDRFAINTSKQIWNCRGCQRGGDVISLVQHLDGCAFDAAVATLSRQDSTRCGNGKNAAGHDVEIEQRKPKRESI